MNTLTTPDTPDTSSTHTITVRLTPDAQAAALARGMPAHEVQTYPIPSESLTTALALPATLRTLTPDGLLRVDVPAVIYYHHDMPDDAAPGIEPYGLSTSGRMVMPPADGAEAIAMTATVVALWRSVHLAHKAEHHAEVIRRDAAVTAACHAWAALSLDERVSPTGGITWPAGGISVERLRDQCPDSVAEVEALAAQRRAEHEVAQAAERAEARRVKLERRAAIGGVEVRIARGGAAWGVPWGARVVCGRPGSSKDVYDFDAGTYDLATETLTITCEPGDVIAWGQKNYRKARHTIHERRRVLPTWELERL